MKKKEKLVLFKALRWIINQLDERNPVGSEIRIKEIGGVIDKLEK